jgi:hypothetical protein
MHYPVLSSSYSLKHKSLNLDLKKLSKKILLLWYYSILSGKTAFFYKNPRTKSAKPQELLFSSGTLDILL